MNKDHETAFLNDPSYADAIRWARIKHDGQKRDYSKTDYVLHPIRVAAELYAEGRSDYVVLAALFHDVVEDTGTSVADVEAHWGKRTASLVEWLTEPSKRRGDHCKMSREERKQEFNEQLAKAPELAQVIKLYDILDNTIDMCRFAHLDLKRANRFLDEKREIVKLFTRPIAPKASLRKWLDELEEIINQDGDK